VQKLVAEIMAAWRRAERLAESLPEGSAERAAALLASEKLRDAYQTLTHSGVAEALTAAEARLLVRDAAADLDREPY
jgi:ABC-type nitrate/sulfonate/bicarbonate transport system substrate-binding protein